MENLLPIIIGYDTETIRLGLTSYLKSFRNSELQRFLVEDLGNPLFGQADIAFTDPGSLYFALDKEEKLKAIYNIYPKCVQCCVIERKRDRKAGRFKR